ncbi:MAG: restriction endonuclease [Candidatus Acidiferrales bacterium]|jgi:hypothetical protein
MKIVETVDVVSAGSFPRGKHWEKAYKDVRAAVEGTDWPHGSGRFSIRPEKHGNGVVPIKTPCLSKLNSLGWEIEALPELEEHVLTPGDLDALLKTDQGPVGFEWETGNISSSHRALNRLLLALYRGNIRGGFLVVPSAKLYQYLTDRIGNITELRPYLPLWRALPVENGILRIIVVEHDAEDKRAKRIPKGTSGRARR